MTEQGFPITNSPLSSYANGRSLPGPEAMAAIAGFSGRTSVELERYLNGQGTLAEYFGGRCIPNTQPLTVLDILLWIQQDADVDELIEVLARSTRTLTEKVQSSSALAKVMKQAIAGEEIKAEDVAAAAVEIDVNNEQLWAIIRGDVSNAE